jgi:hypothetical protein
MNLSLITSLAWGENIIRQANKAKNAIICRDTFITINNKSFTRYKYIKHLDSISTIKLKIIDSIKYKIREKFFKLNFLKSEKEYLDYSLIDINLFKNEIVALKKIVFLDKDFINTIVTEELYNYILKVHHFFENYDFEKRNEKIQIAIIFSFLYYGRIKILSEHITGLKTITDCSGNYLVVM